jgi:hypothetical protein
MKISAKTKRPPKDDFDKMGLRLWHGRMIYGWKSGFGHKWMPNWMKDSISFVWNKVACALIGHDRFTYPKDSPTPDRDVCLSCCKEFKS